MKNYIEIKKHFSDEVVFRSDVSGKSERQIEKIESGMNRNLNHDEYYTFAYETEEEKELIH